MWQQQTLTLRARERGFHLITDEIYTGLKALESFRCGMVHLLLLHTSASLTLNENCSPAVREDMERFFLEMAPDAGRYRHDDEGPDDMPAHIKSSLLGVSLTLPIMEGRLALGTWQGIWLGEHRIYGGPRRILATLQGES